MFNKKKYLSLFIMLVFTGCGTDYILSSFYLRKEYSWPTPPSEQNTLNDYYIPVADDNFNEYNSPSVVSVNSILLMVYERRSEYGADLYGIDGTKRTSVNVITSKDAVSFSSAKKIGTASSHASDSYGSPVSFKSVNNNVVVLATGGIGYGNGTPKEITKISVSISTNNGNDWTEFTNIIDTNMFKPLLDKGYNRYYTIPGNGTVLRNGTLVCTIDYKKETDSDSIGFAVIYSKNNGISWELGSYKEYTGQNRWAKVVAERTDGKLLIAAPSNLSDVYNANGPLSWYILDSLKGNISSFTVEGLPNNSCGTVSGDKITFLDTTDNTSKTGILLLHSTPNRPFINSSGYKVSVKNAMSMSISKDDGKTWDLITNSIGGITHDKTTFRQSMKVLNDGTIATFVEEGRDYNIDPSILSKGYYLTYKRMGLHFLSNGKYKYEGL